jgi:hypothetical protein
LSFTRFAALWEGQFDTRVRAGVRAALQGAEREIRNVTGAIAKGGELESVLDKLRECEKRRSELRAAIDGRKRIQSQQIDRPRLEAAVRHRVDNWRALLTWRPAHRRQLLREMLAEPITFTPAASIGSAGKPRSVRSSAARRVYRHLVYRYGESNPGSVAENHVS